MRAEWPETSLDPAADRQSWGQAMRVYDDSDDYLDMMRCARAFAKALAHTLHGPGFLVGDELPETVRRTLYCSLAKPADGQTFTDETQKCARMGLTVLRENGWQPEQWGGAGYFEELILDRGNRMLLGMCVGPADKPWSGDLGKFFAVPPTPKAETLPSAGDPLASFDAAVANIENTVREAESGDNGAEARLEAFRADQRGDKHEALKWYEESARLGDVQSMFDASVTARALGLTSQETYWEQTAASAGHPNAMFNVGIARSQSGDRSTAKDWFARAAQAGNVEGYAALTQLADEDGDSAAEFSWSKAGAEAGHPFCSMRYGQLLLQRGNGDTHMMRTAVPFLERAGNAGQVGGMFLAGIAHLQLGERAAAGQWLRQAAAGGNARATEILQEQGL